MFLFLVYGARAPRVIEHEPRVSPAPE